MIKILQSRRKKTFIFDGESSSICLLNYCGCYYWWCFFSVSVRTWKKYTRNTRVCVCGIIQSWSYMCTGLCYFLGMAVGCKYPTPSGYGIWNANAYIHFIGVLRFYFIRFFLSWGGEFYISCNRSRVGCFLFNHVILSIEGIRTKS